MNFNYASRSTLYPEIKFKLNKTGYNDLKFVRHKFNFDALNVDVAGGAEGL